MSAGGMPSLGLELGIAPSSAASAGADYMGDAGPWDGSVNLGGGGAEDSWVSGLVRDLVIGVAVALLAKWAWGKLR